MGKDNRCEEAEQISERQMVRGQASLKFQEAVNIHKPLINCDITNRKKSLQPVLCNQKPKAQRGTHKKEISS
jgi:hypothetical protein